MNEEEWKEKLTKEEYEILRAKGTEKPFSSELLNEKSKGKYRCKACGRELFSSEKKFDSGTGWPSFDEAIPGSVNFVHDDAYGMNRTEVLCANCGSHLGHVFDDGPTSTGKRYCVNGTCLDLEKEES
jgi:peptide-methionine (R)-S-oxide reductase